MPRVDQIRWYRDGTAILIQGGWTKPSLGFYRVALTAAESSKTAAAVPVLEGLDTMSESGDNPTFSLDGNALYYLTRANETQSVERLDLASGRRTPVVEIKGDWLRLFALSPDQKQIAYDTQVPRVASNHLFVRDIEGGKPHLLMTAEIVRPQGGLLWPDPVSILFPRTDETNVSDSLIRVPLDGSTPSDLADTGIIARMALHPDGRQLVWESGSWVQELTMIQNLLAK